MHSFPSRKLFIRFVLFDPGQEGDEKAEALEHLNFAINEFREMKMQPSLERALKHKEILGA